MHPLDKPAVQFGLAVLTVAVLPLFLTSGILATEILIFAMVVAACSVNRTNHLYPWRQRFNLQQIACFFLFYFHWRSLFWRMALAAPHARWGSVKIPRFRENAHIARVAMARMVARS